MTPQEMFQERSNYVVPTPAVIAIYGEMETVPYTPAFSVLGYYSFLKQLFPTDYNKNKSNVALYIGLVLILFIMVTPVWIFTLLYFPIAFLLGPGSLSVATMNDLIHCGNPVILINLIHMALFFFIFLKFIVLSKRFTIALNTAEHLTSHFYEEVEIKTLIIEEQNEKLVELDHKKTDNSWPGKQRDCVRFEYILFYRCNAFKEHFDKM